ncbi:hypothetical protein AAKU67_000020 [Oxalobacteraceae bacterium GrIS 2.11]
MRISDKTAHVLTSLAKKYFGADAPVRLFGSRTNDHVRGGDIDIHIIAPNSTFRDEISFLAEVERQLDERVDLRVLRESTLLIDEVAISEGILLHG